jgi:PAS domain S-box-containing protein
VLPVPIADIAWLLAAVGATAIVAAVFVAALMRRHHRLVQRAAHERVEAALSSERNLLRSLIDNLPDHIYIKDMQGRYILDNTSHAKFLGRESSDAITGKTVFDFFPTELAERYAADDRSVLQSGQALVAREEPIVGKDGRTRWISTTKAPFRDTQGAPAGLVCISRDVTDRRQAEQELRAVERFLHSIFENIPDVIFVKSATDLRYEQINRAGEELIGAAPGSVIGKTDHDLFPKVQADFFASMDRAVLQSRKLTEVPAEEIKTPLGMRTLHTTKLVLDDDAGRPRFLLGISRDITDQQRAQKELAEKHALLEEALRSERQALDALKQAQAVLVQSEKMAALGQLVAGVAHEINNPLAFVTNNVAVLQRDLAEIRAVLELYRRADPMLERADPSVLKEIRELSERIDLDYALNNVPDLLHRSRDGLKRIQEIVRNLREFSRESVGELSDSVDLNPGIESTLNIARTSAGQHHVELVAELSPLPGIRCNPSRINQVILNLVMNAIDACEGGGKVTVRSSPTPQGIEISIIDTGSGIPPEILNRIFDPFFTTKPVGRGTGLGLSISHTLITDSGGTIEVDSEPGRGSRFTVRLPAAGGAPAYQANDGEK